MANLHLHHLENSRSFRILWLLEEMGLDYHLVKYDRTKAYLAPQSLEKIHPNGKSPILEIKDIDDANSEKEIVLIESGHIINYLMAKYDSDYKLHPKTDADCQMWRDYDFWLHFAEASMMPPLVMRLIFAKVVERAPTLIKPVAKGIRKQVEASLIAKNVDTTFDLAEVQLYSNHWFAGGEFSAVDIQMAFVVEAANARKSLDRARYTNTLNWLKRCQARPAYQCAVEKGGRLEF